MKKVFVTVIIIGSLSILRLLLLSRLAAVI